MKRVSTSALKPGMVTAEEVFNYKGNLILPKGQTLTAESIEKLEFYSVINVRVEDMPDSDTGETATNDTHGINIDDIDMALLGRNWEEETEPDASAEPEATADTGLDANSGSETTANTESDGNTAPETASSSTAEPETELKTEETPAPQPAPMEKTSYTERLKQTEEFQTFEKDFREATTSFKESMSEVIENVENLNVDDLISHTLSLLGSDNRHVNVFDMLHSMRQMDDNTYVHSMNVSLMCNILARWMKMSEEDIKTATICGLLHDIGTLKIPEKIVKKPGRLTKWEESVMQTHPREGYNILQSAPVDDHVKNAALMHHERCDGSGYPLKLTSAQIDPFAKIVAIADVYDTTTSTRTYETPQCPFTTIAAFEKEGLQKYDPALILTFLKNIVNTYILHRVHLTNGEEGDIVYINPDRLSRPTVRVGNKYIDLTKEPHIFIDALI